MWYIPSLPIGAISHLCHTGAHSMDNINEAVGEEDRRISFPTSPWKHKLVWHYVFISMLVPFATGHVVEVNIGVFMEISNTNILHDIHQTLNRSRFLSTDQIKDFAPPPNNTTNVPGTPTSALPSAPELEYRLVPIIAGKPTLYDPFYIIAKACSLMSQNATVFLSTLPEEGILVLQHVSRYIRVPIFAWNRPCNLPANSSPTSLPYTPLCARKRQLFDVIYDVISPRNWQNIVLLLDGSIDPVTVLQLQEKLGINTTTTVSFELNPPDGFPTTDVNFLDAHTHFLVICNSSNILWTVQQARLTEMDLLGPRYEWLFVEEDNYDVTQLETYFKAGDNVAFLVPHVRSMAGARQQLRLGVRGLDMAMRDVIQSGILPQAATSCRDSTSTRLVYDSFNSALRQTFDAIFTPKVPEVEYQLWTNSYNDQGLRAIIPVGLWGGNASQWIVSGNVFPERKHGFNQRTFKVTARKHVPFMQQDKNGKWTGVLFDLVNQMAFALNFSYTVVQPPDGKWGRNTGNGSYNGMLGMIQRKEVDFGVGVFSLTKERSLIVDFTAPYYIDYHVLIMHQLDLGQIMTFVCLRPFTPLVWVIISVSVVVVGLVQWLLTVSHPLRPSVCPPRHDTLDLRVNIWQTFGALMQQGMQATPPFGSGRLLTGLWWLFIIIMVAVYNGNLIAFLTAPNIPVPVKTLLDLLNSDKKICLVKDTAFHGTLLAVDSGIYRKLWLKALADPNTRLVNTNLEGFQLVSRDPSYVFIDEKTVFESIHLIDPNLMAEGCIFTRSVEQFLPTMFAFPFQPGSPYVHQFSKEIMRIREQGLIQHWIQKWFAMSNNECTGLKRTISQKNISLLEFQGIFYILGIGMAFAVLILIIEKLFYKKYPDYNYEGCKIRYNKNAGHLTEFSSVENHEWKPEPVASNKSTPNQIGHDSLLDILEKVYGPQEQTGTVFSPRAVESHIHSRILTSSHKRKRRTQSQDGSIVSKSPDVILHVGYKQSRKKSKRESSIKDNNTQKFHVRRHNIPHRMTSQEAEVAEGEAPPGVYNRKLSNDLRRDSSDRSMSTKL